MPDAIGVAIAGSATGAKIHPFFNARLESLQKWQIPVIFIVWQFAVGYENQAIPAYRVVIVDIHDATSTHIGASAIHPSPATKRSPSRTSHT